MLQELLLKCCIQSVVMSEVKRICERCFAVLLLPGTGAVFEVRLETSFPGSTGDRPAEKSGLQKAPIREKREPQDPASHCRNQSELVLCSLFLL